MAGKSDGVPGYVLSNELQDFLHKHLSITSSDLQSLLDDVVISYLVDIVTSSEEEEEKEDCFDQFMEIISEYVIELSQIERSVVYDWFVTLPNTLSQLNSEEKSSLLIHDKDRSSHKKKNPNDGLKPKKKQNSKPLQVEKLQQSSTVSAPNNDVPKEYILSRYSHVSNRQSSNPPILPKQEPKKMIRYRDNHVVSTKGEKYISQKPAETEEMKKTYINLKPLRKYRFH